MAQLLDARTSQNASYANSISQPILAVDTPELVGQVGLNVFNPTGIIRVQLDGHCSCSSTDTSCCNNYHCYGCTWNFANRFSYLQR